MTVPRSWSPPTTWTRPNTATAWPLSTAARSWRKARRRRSSDRTCRASCCECAAPSGCGRSTSCASRRWCAKPPSTGRPFTPSSRTPSRHARHCWRIWKLPAWACRRSRPLRPRSKTSSPRSSNSPPRMPRRPRVTGMGRRLAAIIIKEFIQLLRDPRTLMMALLLPVIQLLLFGYAISTDVEHLPTVVVDHSRTQESRALLDRFATSRYYLIRYRTDSLKEAEDLVQGGRARVVIVIPPDFADRLRRGVRAQALVIVDASDPTVARSALTTAEAIGQVASLEIVSRLLGASTARI